MRRLAAAVVVPVLMAATPAVARAADACPPVLNGNGTVTFRYCRPATSVRVVGEWRDPIGTTTNTMALDSATGVWSVTVPLRNHLYSYTLNVNGAANQQDPSNPPWDPTGLQSQIFIPGANSPADPVEHYPWLSPSNPIAHGALHRHLISTVNSTGPFAGGTHPLVVYTPPGYETSGHAYPVLYLSHGAGGNDVDWSTQGWANFIEDNLIASGQATPMVIVMTNFNNTSGDADGYRQDLLQSYIPWVESNYRVYSGRWARAYAGLSMGGRYGQNILANSADQFAYMAIWSPAPLPAADGPSLEALMQPGPKSLSGVHIGAGTNDAFMAQNAIPPEAANLAAAGIPYRVHMTPTDVPDAPAADRPRLTQHTWDSWREQLRDFISTMLFKFSDSDPGTVGGTVPATLSLTLGSAASFGAFTPGLEKTYSAQTSANVISTAGDAALTYSDPGHLANGAFSLPEALQVNLSKASWTGPVSNDVVTIAFTQHIGATDALRTGSYSRTLTFTLSTTSP